MSGGTFNYDNYLLNQIADTIDAIIYNNHIKDQFGYSTDYSDITIKKLQDISDQCRKLERILHEVDYMQAGDTCEETFNQRVYYIIHEEIKELTFKN